MDMIRIGNFIAEQRREKALTQEQLASKLGVTQKSVSRWETGRNLPDASVFEPLCSTLGITINELFAGERLEKDAALKQSDKNIVSIVKDSSRRRRVLTYFIAGLAAVAVILLAAFTGTAGRASGLEKELNSARHELEELKGGPAEIQASILDPYELSSAEKELLSVFGPDIRFGKYTLTADKSIDSMTIYLTTYRNGRKENREKIGGMSDLANFADNYNKGDISLILNTQTLKWSLAMNCNGTGTYTERSLDTETLPEYTAIFVRGRTEAADITKGRPIDLYALAYINGPVSTMTVEDLDTPHGEEFLKSCSKAYIISVEFE